ncbi:Hypothetical protein, putative, partial [Bodo saltans]
VLSPPKSTKQNETIVETITSTESVLVEDLCESPKERAGDLAANSISADAPPQQTTPSSSSGGVDGPWRLPPPPANRFVAVVQRQVLPMQKFAAAGQRKSLTAAGSSQVTTSKVGGKLSNARASVSNPLSIAVAADGSGSMAGSSLSTEVAGSPRRLSMSAGDSS